MAEKWFLFERMYALPIIICPNYLRYPLTLEDNFKLNSALFFKHRRVSMIYPKKRFADVALAIFKKFKSNPGWYKDINNQIRETSTAWKKYCDDIKKKNIKDISNSELAGLYRGFFKCYSVAHGLGYWGNMLEFEHEYFTNFAKDIIEKRLKEMKLDIELAEAFILLSTPEEKSYFKKDEEDFRELFIKIFNDKEASGIFKKEDIIQLKDKKPEIYKLLTGHYEKYLWLPFMYEGPPLDLDYFFTRMKQMLENETLESIERKKRKEELLSKKRKSLLLNLDFNDYDKQIIDLLQETVFLKGWRKDIFYHACYVITPLFEEVAKRLNLSLDEVRYFLPEEFIKALETGEFDKETLAQRFEKSLYLIDMEGNEIFLLGDEAESKFKELYEAEKIEKISEIKGSCAYHGKVKGTVKVINHPAEMSKIEKGDIMVSHSTNPNLVPAMEKAGAIVTDVGGITCHAAIVSRELKTPCVIGTNIATSVLKDGDMVEVDATNGIVKKL